LKKRHAQACEIAEIAYFPPYTFRHTCLTRWATKTKMDPYTLAYLAGHSDFGTTRYYVHPQMETVRTAMGQGSDEHTLSGRGEITVADWLVTNRK
jgi:integrase